MKLLTSACILSLFLSVVHLPECAAKSTKSPKGSKTKKKSGKNSKKSKERVVTMWWVLFNKPSACITDPGGPIQCGVPDIMGNADAETNDPNIAIINASGGIADEDGFLRLVASLYKTDSCALDLVADDGTYVWGGPPALYGNSSFGFCPADGETTEVHVVIRDHGPVSEEDKIAQLTTFTDPSCSQVGGPNLCSDIGAVGFAPMTEDGLMSKDIGHFPMFPPGCAEAEECDESVEKIQLMAGMGNEVTLISTGDAVQVVTEITLPNKM